jgi:hypothetical protein
MVNRKLAGTPSPGAVGVARRTIDSTCDPLKVVSRLRYQLPNWCETQRHTWLRAGCRQASSLSYRRALDGHGLVVHGDIQVDFAVGRVEADDAGFDVLAGLFALGYG